MTRPRWRKNAVFAMSASLGPRNVCSSPMPVSVVSGAACVKRRCLQCFFPSCRKPWFRATSPRPAGRRSGGNGASIGSPAWIATNRHRPPPMPCVAVRPARPLAAAGRSAIRSSTPASGLVKSPTPSAAARRCRSRSSLRGWAPRSSIRAWRRLNP